MKKRPGAHGDSQNADNVLEDGAFEAVSSLIRKASAEERLALLISLSARLTEAAAFDAGEAGEGVMAADLIYYSAGLARIADQIRPPRDRSDYRERQ